ncbi:MAG: GFA family protein [Myxococcales bacterium]
MTQREGGCQCGRVRYRISVEPLFLAACHCKECQRASGSAFSLSLMVPEQGFSYEGELKLFERSSDSGRPLRCYFCPECGTRIYHQPSYAMPVVNVRAGTLDDTSWLQPKMHTWTRSKQPWAPIPEGIPTHPTQP